MYGLYAGSIMVEGPFPDYDSAANRLGYLVLEDTANYDLRIELIANKGA